MENKKYLSGTFFSKTDVGKIRVSNEDRTVSLVNSRGNVLLAVFDGMGGQNKGDYASTLGANILKDCFLNKSRFTSKISCYSWITKTIREINKSVFDEANRDETYSGMGSTMTMVLILPKFFLVAQVGDSRCYVLRNKVLTQLTEDQTLVNYLYRTGKITKDEMKTHPKRHILMNAIGTYPMCEADINTYPYLDETILVCSDGLTNNVKEKEIESILKTDDTTEQKTNELISLANANGGSDNIAVVLWEAHK